MEKHKKERVEAKVANGSGKGGIGAGGTARNEAEKAHINNEMAQCSRGQGREEGREEESEWGMHIKMQAAAT